MVSTKVEKSVPSNRPIYYLPGRGGRLLNGLGLALQERGLEVVGRELVGDFQRMRFSDQVSQIAQDLKNAHWSSDDRLIANSYGAYLFLHAQIEMLPFPGKVLLLSPIVGGAPVPGGRAGFSPPFAERIFEHAKRGQMNAPVSCEMHVGELDWQCMPSRVAALAGLFAFSKDCQSMCLERSPICEIASKLQVFGMSCASERQPQNRDQRLRFGCKIIQM